MKNLIGLLFLALFATLFAPELTIDEDGTPDIQIVQEAFAEGQGSGGEGAGGEGASGKKKTGEGRKDGEGEEGEEGEEEGESDDPDPEPDPKPKKKHHGPKNDPDPEPKDFNPDDYVSKDEYNELKSQFEDLSEARQQEVIDRRVEHAINEEYIDGEDDDAVDKVRKIARDDESWEAFKEVAKPKTPDHIAAQRFQSKNLKSNKTTSGNDLVDKVLEHQKA